MECEERKVRLCACILLTLVVGQVWWRSADAAPMEGEFVAGSFILTQKSLNEAPYREDDRIEFSIFVFLQTRNYRISLSELGARGNLRDEQQVRRRAEKGPRQSGDERSAVQVRRGKL